MRKKQTPALLNEACAVKQGSENKWVYTNICEAVGDQARLRYEDKQESEIKYVYILIGENKQTYEDERGSVRMDKSIES